MARGEKSEAKRPIHSYKHRDKQRVNNPPVGLVTPETDPIACYACDNPVKHGHVEQFADWPHSTFHRWVTAGVYPDDWGRNVVADTFAGERS